MNRPRLAVVARQRGDLALLVFRDALSDAKTPGVVDAEEAPVLYAALGDWHAATGAVDATDALMRSIGRSASPRRLRLLTDAAQAAMDAAGIDDEPEAA